MLKEFRLLMRDRTSIVLMTAVPVVVISVAGLALSGIYGTVGANVKIYLPVADLDQRELSPVLPEALKKSGFFNLDMVSEARAYELVRDANKAAAAIIIPRGFTKDFLAGDQQKIVLITDPAKTIEISAIRGALEEFEARLAFTLLELRSVHSSAPALIVSANPSLIAARISSLMQKGYTGPVSFDEKNLTGVKKNITSFDQTVPGFSIMFAMFGMLYGFSESIFKERDEDKTLKRFLAAPVGLHSLVAGKLLAKITTGFVQILILFTFGYFAFNMSLGNSLIGILVTAAGVSFSAASIGLLVSSISNTREQARSLGTLVILTLAGLGGCWWPIFVEPRWMQQLSLIAMPAWGMNCFYNFMLRGKSIQDTTYHIAGLYVYGIVALTIGLFIFSKWDEKRLL
jgi:linearmycin/streptolysin S transport system permease protein